MKDNWKWHDVVTFILMCCILPFMWLAVWGFVEEGIKNMKDKKIYPYYLTKDIPHNNFKKGQHCKLERTGKYSRGLFFSNGQS